MAKAPIMNDADQNLGDALRELTALRQWVEELEACATQSQQAQQTFQASLERFTAILQGVTDGILAQDTTGRLLYANDVMARLLGYPAAQDVLGALPQDMVLQVAILDEVGTPFPLEQLPACVLTRGANPPSLLHFHNLSTGEQHWSVVKAQAVSDGHEQRMLVVSTFHDITSLKRAEQDQYLLAEASRTLVESLDYLSGLTNLVRLIASVFADWCVVDMVTEAGIVQRLAIAHADPAKEQLVRQLQHRYAILKPQATHTILKVMRTGQSWIDPEISESRFVAEARDPEHLSLLRQLGFKSEMVIPLLAHGRTLGTMTFVRAASQPRYGPADLTLAEELARRVAVAIDNARLYQEAQQLNAELEQRVAARTAELQAINTQLENEIAERRQAEQALRRSEEYLRSLIENASDIVTILDARGVIRYASPAAERVLGYTLKGVVGKNVFAFVHTDDVADVRTMFRETIGVAGLTRSATFRMQHLDGSWRMFEVIGKNLLDNPAIAGVVVHARDITARKQAEEQLQRQQEILAQSEKLAAMGSLLANVAHELNNPLAIVVMEADLLSEAMENGPLLAHAGKITQAARRCAHIVHNFLTLARQHPPKRIPVEFNALITETVELLAYPLQVDNVEVHLHLAATLPLLLADPHQLRQVVINLVTNAHHALRETPAARHLVLTTRADAAQDSVVLEVTDTGPGIPLELQTRIFEPFFTTKPTQEGTGLGLSLCRGILEAHGGSIRVQSQPGQGTSFLIELPIGETAMSVAQPPAIAELPSAQGKAILIIDDESGIRNGLAHLLRRDGYKVETAANGLLGLAKLQEQVFDLVLCDLRMPKLDGPGLYRELQHRQPQILPQIIFLTGDTLSPETRAFLEQTNVPRLTKPFTAAEVRRVVGRAVHEASQDT
jgi:two-component system NtrC family sensor kinase